MNKGMLARLCVLEQRRPAAPTKAKADRDAEVSAALLGHRSGGTPIMLPTDSHHATVIGAALRADA